MTRLDRARLDDIADAIGAIHKHLERGDLHDGLMAGGNGGHAALLANVDAALGAFWDALGMALSASPVFGPARNEDGGGSLAQAARH